MLRTTVIVTLVTLGLQGMTAWGDGTTRHSSTYVPGARTAVSVPAYSQRGSAVAIGRDLDRARGGGPVTADGDRGREIPARVPIARDLRRHGLQSDNQTRRPGATNYTGPSFKPSAAVVSGQGEAHRSSHGTGQPSSPTIIGNSFGSRTGSATTGRIPARAAESNESTFRSRSARPRTSPRAIGGGPTAVREASTAVIDWPESRQAPTPGVRKCP